MLDRSYGVESFVWKSEPSETAVAVWFLVLAGVDVRVYLEDGFVVFWRLCTGPDPDRVLRVLGPESLFDVEQKSLLLTVLSAYGFSFDVNLA